MSLTRFSKRKITIRRREFDSIQSAANAFGLSRNTLDYRLSKGWTPEQAVGLEPRPGHAASTPGMKVIVQGHEFKSIREAAKYFGRSYTHIFSRLKEGCTIEQALGLVKRTDSFKTEYPEMSQQWHPTKNFPLTPDSVTPHSGQKVWWLCPKGHEWRAVINSRARGGHGCPYCAGQRPTKERNFEIKYPELIKEWDWEKNIEKPANFSPRSKKKVWWKCNKGHSWQATIQNRTRNWKSICPICSNRKLGEDNSLAQVRPDIALDWHPSKNATLSPNDVVAGGSKRVWWICKHGHEWQATVGSRVISGTGCSKCSLQTSRIEISIYTELEALFSDVAWREKISGYECDIYLSEQQIGIEVDGVYWHRQKPERELAKSKTYEKVGIQLYRLREDGLSLLSERDISFKSSEAEFLVVSRLVISLLKHAKLTDQQRAKLQDYINGPGLVNEKLYRKLVAILPAPPPGQSFADNQPDIAAQWAYDLNAPLSPEHFYPKANKKVWWRCSNGHTWKTTINIRTQQGTGCPHCPRPFFKVKDERNLADLYPDISDEWHPDKNGEIRPNDVRPKSNRKFWWRCKNGHDWLATVTGRTAGHGCPYCYGRYATRTNNLAIQYPELIKEWDYVKNHKINPFELTTRSNKKAWWCCKNGHSWQATISNRTGSVKSGCPVCAKDSRRKYTIESFQTYAIKLGGICMTEKYNGLKTKLKFRCKNGHVWVTRADNILYEKMWCPMCLKGELTIFNFQ